MNETIGPILFEIFLERMRTLNKNKYFIIQNITSKSHVVELLNFIDIHVSIYC